MSLFYNYCAVFTWSPPQRNSSYRAKPLHYRSFTTTLTHITHCSTPLDEGLARSTHVRLKLPNTNNRQASMPSAWFEPAIPANVRPQNHKPWAAQLPGTPRLWYTNYIVVAKGRGIIARSSVCMKVPTVSGPKNIIHMCSACHIFWHI